MRIKINDEGSDGAGVEGRRNSSKEKKSSEPSQTPVKSDEPKKKYGGSLKIIEGEDLPGKADRN